MITDTRGVEQKPRRYRPGRCSICTNFTWFRPVALDEPVEVPEQRLAWLLCQPCYKALLIEMRRSSLRSPLRLRIAIGIVAAERSPRAYTTAKTTSMGSPEFQREFAIFTWFLIFFAALHLIILVIIWAGIR